MQRPHFSSMLRDRRRALGYTTAQASRVLRLREDVLIAFEEGQFDFIPKSGYAQGMLASYARYLGLSPHLVVDQFTQDLADFNRASNTGSTSEGVRKSYSGARGLLPTSGGYAGDLSDFSTTTPVRSRDDKRYTAREPQQSVDPHLLQAQNRRAQSRDRIRFESYDQASTGDLPEQRPGRQPFGSYQKRGYRPRIPVDKTERTRQYVPHAATGRVHYGEVTRRGVPSQYIDDLSYDSQANPCELASSQRGRASSRNIASSKRPNVRRRQSARVRSDLKNRTQNSSQNAGLVGQLFQFLSDKRHVTILIIAATVLLLTLIIASSISSCVAALSDTGRSNRVLVGSLGQTDNLDTGIQTITAPQGSDEPQGSAAQSSDSSKAEDGEELLEQSEEEKKVEVNISLARDEVSWLEITLDGKSEVAATKTGPWTQTYTVEDLLKVEASNPSAVSVSLNGKVQKFEKKASGVGTLTIKGIPKPEEGADKDGSGAEDDTAQDTTAGEDSNNAATQ